MEMASLLWPRIVRMLLISGAYSGLCNWGEGRGCDPMGTSQSDCHRPLTSVRSKSQELSGWDPTCLCSDHTQASIPVMLIEGTVGLASTLVQKAAQVTQTKTETRRGAHSYSKTPHTPSAFLDLQNGVPAFAILAPSCLHNLILGLPWQTILHCHFCSGLLHRCCVRHCSNALTLSCFFFFNHTSRFLFYLKRSQLA